jgi:hypothetical protein
MTLREAYVYGSAANARTGIARACEIEFFLERYDLRRALFLAYDRVALFGREDQGFSGDL